MKNDFIVAITQLAAEKNLPKEVVFDAVEAALSSAYKRDEWVTRDVVVKIDHETGATRVYTRRTVVEEVSDPEVETTLEEARRIKPGAQLGDGIDTEVAAKNSGRVAAQTAKQVVLQRLREAEREVVFEEYSGREGDIVSGEMARMEGRNVIIDLGKAEALLPSAEQVRNEHYRSGQRLKFYVVEVYKAAKGPQVVVSRTHKNLIRSLFEMEVPEIFKGAVEVKAIAREAGYRSKVAVWSTQEGVDPVGACVGLRGIRIQNVVNELNGERIDVVLWNAEPGRFAAHALSPAQVVNVMVHEETKTAEVVVPDRQLSLAIGKEGQNARLAAKLTGWRIDIKSESAYDEFIEAHPEAQPAPADEAAEAAEAAGEPSAEAVAAAEEPAPAVAEAVAPEGEVAGDVVEEAASVVAEATAEPPAEPAVAEEKPLKSKIRFAEEILTGEGEGEEKAKKGKAKKAVAEEKEAAPKAKKARKPKRAAAEEEDDEFEYPVA